MEEEGRELVVSPVNNRTEHYENGQKVYENLGHKPNAVHAGNFAFDRGFDTLKNSRQIGRFFQKCKNSFTVRQKF